MKTLRKILNRLPRLTNFLRSMKLILLILKETAGHNPTIGTTANKQIRSSESLNLVWKKNDFEFLTPLQALTSLTAPRIGNGNYIYSISSELKVTNRWGAGAIIFKTHEYSGVIQIKTIGDKVETFYVDLFSQIPGESIVRFNRDVQNITIKGLGRSRYTQGAGEIVFKGLLVEKSSSESILDFVELQKGMLRDWENNIISMGLSVSQVKKQRQTAYLMRWKETEPFFNERSRVLDIGGGQLYEDLLLYFSDRKFDYNFIDIDQNVVDQNKTLAHNLDLDTFNFIQGINSELPFTNNSIDCVFASHSVEHSPQILQTMDEIHRILKPGGYCFLAVPFEHDHSTEHIYFLDQMDWLELIKLSTLELVSKHVGKFYPETGYDLCLVLQKNSF